MQVSIDHRGQMLILPDTPLEAYALKKWAEDNLVRVDNAIAFHSVLIDATPPHERSPAQVFTV